MSNYFADRGRPADPLRLVALTAVIAGVVLLAAAAFVLSYAGIHQLALSAGITPELARLYPPIFDAMVVIAGAAALALRGAGWWARCYAWLSLLIVIVAIAVGDALHATHVALPSQPTRAVAAVLPWVFLLAAFGLWLAMLRHFRQVRAVAAGDSGVAGQAASGTGSAGAGDGDPGSPAQRAAANWADAGDDTAGGALPQPRTGLDLLLGPREEDPPAMPGTRPDDSRPTEEYPGRAGRDDTGHHPDQVAYGEETGYVHPDTYRDHEDHAGTGHEDSAGPDGPSHQGHGDDPAQDHPDAQIAATGTGNTASAAEDASPPPGDAGPPGGDATSPAEDAGPPPGDAGPPAEDAGPPPGDATPPAEDATPPAEGAASPGGDAAASTGTDADGQAGGHEAGGPQPAAANTAATAQAARAQSPHPPAPHGDATQPAVRVVMPLLERLRSTPAPPGD